MQGPNTFSLLGRSQNPKESAQQDQPREEKAQQRRKETAASQRVERGRSLGGRSLRGRPEEPHMAGDSREGMGTGNELCCFHRVLWASSRDSQMHCKPQKTELKVETNQSAPMTIWSRATVLINKMAHLARSQAFSQHCPPASCGISLC